MEAATTGIRILRREPASRIKAMKRLKILPVLFEEEAFSDVVREAQEIVEPALKGILRPAGIEPPKWHDVGQMILEYRHRFPEAAAARRLAGRL